MVYKWGIRYAEQHVEVKVVCCIRGVSDMLNSV